MTQNQTPSPRRVQTPEDTLARMAGVPRTPEEQQADRQALEEERVVQAQRMAGTYQGQQEQSHQQRTPRVSDKDQEREKDQREKA